MTGSSNFRLNLSLGSALGGGVSLYQRLLNEVAPAVLYDPSDLTSLYQSRTGGSSTGAADAVVGIMLDKSLMGNQTAESFIAGQPELVTNGNFASDTAWAKGTGWTIGGGVATLTTNTGLLTQAGILAANAWYVVTINVVSETGDIRIRPGPTGSVQLSVGSNTLVVQATGTDFSVIPSGSASAVIDNVSVKAIPGYHALAPSDAARPILRQASGLSYLETDGVDDWMQVFPTLNLGSTFWHVGGWRADGADNYAFATANTTTGSLRAVGGAWSWRNDANTAHDAIATGSPATVDVATVEFTDALVAGRYNGGNGLSFNPRDAAGTRGLALFSGNNASWSAGLAGRFYGGLWKPAALTSSQRAIAEQWAALKAGVTL